MFQSDKDRVADREFHAFHESRTYTLTNKDDCKDQRVIDIQLISNGLDK